MKKQPRTQQNIEGVLKKIHSWQTQHRREDILNFEAIQTALKKIPTEETIKESITSTIKVVVNGKIDAIKIHLDKQDETSKEMKGELKKEIKELSDKVQPFDNAKIWGKWSVKGLAYVAGILGSISIIAVAIKYFL